MEVDRAISGMDHRSSAIRSAEEMGLAVKKEKEDNDSDDTEKSDGKNNNGDEDENS